MSPTGEELVILEELSPLARGTELRKALQAAMLAVHDASNPVVMELAEGAQRAVLEEIRSHNRSLRLSSGQESAIQKTPARIQKMKRKKCLTCQKMVASKTEGTLVSHRDENTRKWCTGGEKTSMDLPKKAIGRGPRDISVRTVSGGLPGLGRR